MRSRRDQAEIQKERFVHGLSLCHGKSSCQEPCAQRVNATTLASWQRSPAALQSQPIAIPRDDEHSILATWEASPLRQAVSPELDKLNRLVQEDTFVAAIADPNGKLLWTAEHPSLRPFTETIKPLHLRTLLDGSISSRTYRLLCTVWVDFVEWWTVLRLHQDEVARSLRSGELLPASQSPEIREWRNCLNAISSANARHGAFFHISNSVHCPLSI